VLVDYEDVAAKLRELEDDLQLDVDRLSEMVFNFPAGNEPLVLHTREGREIYDAIESALKEYMKKNKPPKIPQSVCPLPWTQANMNLLALVAVVRQKPCHLYVKGVHQGYNEVWAVHLQYLALEKALLGDDIGVRSSPLFKTVFFHSVRGITTPSSSIGGTTS